MGKCVGVVLAGGNGTRLSPLTRTINKHLLPVNGQPMLHWPVATLQSMGISEVVVVLGGKSCGNVVEHFGSSYYGTGPGISWIDPVSISYVYQSEAGGIPDAFKAAIPLLKSMNADRAMVILGDNIFPVNVDLYSRTKLLKLSDKEAGVLSKSDLADVSSYGCVPVPVSKNINPPEKVLLVEKPDKHPSEYDSEFEYCRWSALLGVYSLPVDMASEYCDNLKRSKRNELEITDLLMAFSNTGDLVIAEQNGNWIDAGDPEGYDMANDKGFWK